MDVKGDPQPGSPSQKARLWMASKLLSSLMMAFQLDIFLIIRYNKHILQKC